MQKKMADPTDVLIKHKGAFSNSQKALQEETVACVAIVSAVGALQMQVSDLKAKTLSLKELNQKLLENAFSVPHISTGKRLDRLSASVLTGLLEISLKMYQPPSSWPARKVSKLSPDRETFTRNEHSSGKHSYQHATETQRHNPVGPLLHLALSSQAENYTLVFFSHTFVLADVIDAELKPKQYFLILSSQTSKQDVVSTLSSSFTLLEIVRQPISDIAFM